MSGSGALAWQTGASRCSGDLTNERKHVGNQRCHKHDVVDVFVGLPACISIARVWQPEVDDLSPKRLVRQKELDSALQDFISSNAAPLLKVVVDGQPLAKLDSPAGSSVTKYLVALFIDDLINGSMDKSIIDSRAVPPGA